MEVGKPGGGGGACGGGEHSVSEVILWHASGLLLRCAAMPK